MNFFERQQQARASSRRLVFLFALAVIGIIAAIDLAVWFALGVSQPLHDVERSGAAGDSRVAILVVVSLLTLAVIGISSLVRIAMLRGGGAEVARSMGATPVSPDTTDPALRRLRNVVEEIAIASSTPMPEIYVMEEEGINAFAAGYSPNDAVVAVTRGALDRLNRDELQGVVAHEFSHILNGDMRLNIRLMGVLFGILVLGIIGRRILMHVRGGRDSKGVAAVIAAGVVLMIVGYVGLFFGRLIKAGVSRSREVLADASAVQFTRQTQGLAGALKKIAGLPAGSRLDNGDTEEVSHMLFGEGLGFSSLFATHPPILERIKAIDPSFDPKQFEQVKARWAQRPPVAAEEDLALGFAPDGSRLATRSVLPVAHAELDVSPQLVAAQVGSPAADDFQRADAIGNALTEELRELARRQDRAIPLVLALLLDADASLRERQLSEVARSIDESTAMATRALHENVAAMHPMLRLPLASLAFPVLRRRPRPELARFLQCCERLIAADGRVALSEYCLGRLLRRQTVESLDPSRYAPSGRRKLVQVRDAVATLLAVLAEQGHNAETDAQRAFVAGMARVFPGVATRYAPPPDFVAALEQALSVLDEVDPMGKSLLVEAMVTAISHDGHVSVAEAELLRTVCAVLHCPLPPMLEH
ncbi:M48 family metallopeptidase [Xanthomonadaceae bacterium JHOS43]|nr:M48 family metallopeptidase [Xanthomonadaceae bacterium JHOS43]